MRYPLLHRYLSRLANGVSDDAKLWTDGHGRVQGQFFHCALTSVFQPVRDIGGEVRAFDAFAHSYLKQDSGLSVWRMLNNAASDDESVELDRLCRVIHVLNYFRQLGDVGQDLLIGVHERLLAAVSGNHGAVFRHILDALELPVGRILLQLPQAGADRQWAIGFVVDNYRRNGFRIATQATGVDEAARQLEQLRPDLIRLDIHAAGGVDQLAHLIEHAVSVGSTLLFSRVDEAGGLDGVIEALDASGTAAADGLWFTGLHAGEPEPWLNTATGMSPSTGRPPAASPQPAQA